MSTTSSALYSKPLRPRIRIYAFTDSTYTTPLYEYNPFTAAHGDPNPVSKLSFNTSTTNVGDCEIGIENNDGGIDIETFRKGNRIRIDMSKDGSTWYDSFKGLVRGAGADVFATEGQTLNIRGYSYLIRLKERIMAAIIESNKIDDDTYDRTDSTMFTNTLVDYILGDDANYVFSADDTQLYNIVKRDNILTSPVKAWVPRVDAQFLPVGDALSELLQYSNALLLMNMENDQLMLYNPDEALNTGINSYLITTAANKNADPADFTMYPREPYKYDIDNDFPDHANRIVVSYGSPLTSPGEAGTPTEPSISLPGPSRSLETHSDFGSGLEIVYTATHFVPTTTPIKDVRLGVANFSGNNYNSTSKLQIRTHNSSSNLPATLLGTMTLYPANPFLGGSGATYVSSNSYPGGFPGHVVLGTAAGAVGPTVTPGNEYWAVFYNNSSNAFSSGNTSGLSWYVRNSPSTGRSAYSFDSDNSWSESTGTKDNAGRFILEFAGVVGGSPAVNEDQLVVGRDTNAMKKWGQIERAETSLPEHVVNRQTIDNFLYPQLYTSAKPRVAFDYPSLTMPNIPPKAGDIVAHIDPLLKVGTKTTPIQTTVITDTRYEFGDGSDSVIGLTKLGLTSIGMRRGYY